MNIDYNILGLKQGASQEEIKKAYFKMVRLHSPESDPEQFQKIRQAYEHLKNAKNKPDGPVFPPLSDPLAVKMMHQIQVYRNDKNIILYRNACEEAWKRFPEDLQFLYLLIMAQRRCGNTGKAVKNAELLVSKDQENKWFWMVLAFSYMERGFNKKAFTACKKAYKLGCLDLDFLLMYANACNENLYYKKGVQVLMNIIKQDTRWNREDMPKLIDAYMGMITMNYHSKENFLAEILDSLSHFLEQYSIYTKEYLTHLTYLLANACINVTYSSKEYNYVVQIFAQAKKICQDKDDKMAIQSSEELYYFNCMAADRRIDDILVSYLELFHDFDLLEEDDPMMKKFAMTDLQLCMIKQREEILRQAAILEQEHPHEYKNIADFIQKLKNESKLNFLEDSLLKTFHQLEPFFYDSKYYELYPMEKTKAMGTLIHEGAENEPYIRSTKKIGRNDPCPCGSGKKYKHCCMNK